MSRHCFQARTGSRNGHLARRTAGCAILALTAALAACGPPEPPAPPPLEIPVVEVIKRDQPILVEFVGQTLGSVDIPIRARVQGFLESMDFLEGRNVEKDDLLYTIDPLPFEAFVVEADGYVAGARTMLAKSKSDLARIRPLAEMKAVSQQDLDSAVAEYEAAIGSLQAANAQLDQANIQLSYTRIHSPIAGRIGISAAKVGEFVGAEPNPVVLNFVSKTDPIRVRFAINEREYLRWAREFSELREEIDGSEKPDKGPGLELILADDTVHTHRGHVVVYDAAINPTTGTFTLEADFPNPNNIILAGQFARIRGIIEVRDDAILVPQRAVSELQGNFRVFVIRDDGTAEVRDVKPGPRVDNLWIMDSGLNAGEKVAVEGLLRLSNEMKVNPRLVSIESLSADLGNKDTGG
jgi:membrane fusion protein (multidrug efflux system)